MRGTPRELREQCDRQGPDLGAEYRRDPGIIKLA